MEISERFGVIKVDTPRTGFLPVRGVVAHTAALLYQTVFYRSAALLLLPFGTDQTGAIVAFYDMTRDPYQMNDEKDNPDHKTQILTLKARLDSYVEENDGYVPWEQLLEKAGLAGEWERSEAYFAEMFRD